jgi:hypothetical protein
MKWITKADNCGAIVFKLRIINNVHASTESLHRRGMTLSLATNVKHTAESGDDVTELTPMNVVVTPRSTRSSSKTLTVGKR